MARRIWSPDGKADLWKDYLPKEDEVVESTTEYLLALDLGKTTGWALIDDMLDLLDSGVWRLQKKGKNPNPVSRYALLIKNLDELYREYGFQHLAYEEAGYATRSHLARVWYFGYQAHVELFCYQRGIKVYSRTPSEIKKYTTGEGRADKEAMIASIQNTYQKLKIVDSNHADAIALALMASDEIWF